MRFIQTANDILRTVHIKKDIYILYGLFCRINGKTHFCDVTSVLEDLGRCHRLPEDSKDKETFPPPMYQPNLQSQNSVCTVLWFYSRCSQHYFIW